MDQVSIFSFPEQEAYLKIKLDLEKVIVENGLDPSSLKFEKRRNYCSVMFEGSVVTRIADKPNPYISIPFSAIASFDNLSSFNGIRSNEFIRFQLLSLDDINSYLGMIQFALNTVIDRNPKEFSCCSRYLECSNARVCTNPNKDLAIKCGYRKILKSGRVFYGENRNA